MYFNFGLLNLIDCDFVSSSFCTILIIIEIKTYQFSKKSRRFSIEFDWNYRIKL